MLLVRLPQTDMKPYRNTVTNDDLQCPHVCMYLPRLPCSMKIRYVPLPPMYTSTRSCSTNSRRPFSTVSRQCLPILCCQPHRTSPLDPAQSSTFQRQTHKTRPFATATNFCCLLRKRRAFDGNHLSTCHRTDFPGGFGSAFARGPHFSLSKEVALCRSLFLVSLTAETSVESQTFAGCFLHSPNQARPTC